MTISIKRKIELGKEAKELAIQQRREWELGIEPIPSVFSLLESKGILIVRFPAENCDLSGFAMHHPIRSFFLPGTRLDRRLQLLA